ncbi:uncharacterized protein LOC122390029 [Amphibalanus amphitrite]|uniref:uncharacterized protein LOC122390029 n=1 Tax=Amphibalanus amphitrite TaxID=1232801 RepID=UPI001C900BE8|nr:uncharacterized protein LOC122390029 [Amphibalanus amphitrite]
MSSSPSDELLPPLGRPPPLTESTVSLAGSERADSEFATPVGGGGSALSGRAFLTAASSMASIDDSTVSIAGTDRPDIADLDGEGLSSDEAEDGDAGVVSGSLQFALNAPVSEVRATVQPSEPTPPDVKEKGVCDLGQELDEPSPVYTGRPGDPELPEGIDADTVTVLTNEYGCKAWLIGTAHFSKKSQEDVAKLIQFVQPECVMLELCRGRVNILEMDEDNIEEELKALNMERVISILRQNGTVQGCLYLLMLNLSAHLTRELGMAPGGEFRVAYQEARKLPGCEVRLGDRPIQITIQRALSSLSVWKKIRLAYNLLTSKGSITKEEVERCKQKELLEEMLEEMAGDFPGLGEVFVNERDVFLCASLADAARVVPCNTLAGWRPSRTVGVVGMGHVPGMIRNWGKVDHRDQAALMSRRPPTLLGRAVWFTFRVTFWGAVAYAVYRVAPVPRKEAWVTGLRDSIVTNASAVRHTLTQRFASYASPVSRYVHTVIQRFAITPTAVTMEDDYSHASPGLFYTEENCPGLGCDRSLFNVQLAGCDCSECGDGCPCGLASDSTDDAAVSDAADLDVATSAGPLVECNSACACGPECARRVIQRGPQPGLSVFDAGARGLGLQTDVAIPRGAFVCCYAGEVVGPAEAARRFAAQTEHNYILAVREHCAGRTTTTFIDATRVCNIGHYANHSCRPNLRLRPVRVDTPVPHAALFAARDVAAGEELTFSYGPAGTPGGRRCLCGEPTCAGVLPCDPRVTEEAQRALAGRSDGGAAPQEHG